MARGPRRRPDEIAAPPDLDFLAGGNGPYSKTDKAEFHHASREAQEWFLRLDDKDVGRVAYAAQLGFWVQTGLKWARWAFWAFTGGLSAALAAGENLQKLPGKISAVFSLIRGWFP
jgi:hypothetical protein